jgi:hypothetical protein
MNKTTLVTGASSGGISDYDAFARVSAACTTSAEDGAKVNYGAATDGLRGLVCDDASGFVRARDEMGNAEYVAFMGARSPSGG